MIHISRLSVWYKVRVCSPDKIEEICNTPSVTDSIVYVYDSACMMKSKNMSSERDIRYCKTRIQHTQFPEHLANSGVENERTKNATEKKVLHAS